MMRSCRLWVSENCTYYSPLKKLFPRIRQKKVQIYICLLLPYLNCADAYRSVYFKKYTKLNMFTYTLLLQYVWLFSCVHAHNSRSQNQHMNVCITRKIVKHRCSRSKVLVLAFTVALQALYTLWMFSFDLRLKKPSHKVLQKHPVFFHFRWTMTSIIQKHQ